MTEDDRIESWIVEARNGDVFSLGMALESFRTYLQVIARDEIDEGLQAKAGASDLVQQTFIDAHRDFARFRGGQPQELRAWLRQILKNNLANFKRDYRATEKRSVSREVRADSQNHSTEWLLKAVGMETPSQQVVADEEVQRISAAIARLSAEYQQVIDLRVRAELPLAEIALRMDRSENAVQKLWMRAVEALGQELGVNP